MSHSIATFNNQQVSDAVHVLMKEKAAHRLLSIRQPSIVLFNQVKHMIQGDGITFQAAQSLLRQFTALLWVSVKMAYALIISEKASMLSARLSFWDSKLPSSGLPTTRSGYRLWSFGIRYAGRSDLPSPSISA